MIGNVAARLKMVFEQDLKCPSARSWCKQACQTLAFWGGYLIFGGLGSAISIVCLPLAAVFRGERARRFGQRFISRLFAFFVWYLRTTGLLELEASDLFRLRNSRGLVIVANHPSLLDVVFIVSQLPHVCCLMKASLVRNVVLCGTAKLAGYVDNSSAAGLVRTCEDRLLSGGNLLIFPEGTRTHGRELGPFKMGFALMAQRTQAPVQTLLIKINSNFLGKGWPFFKQPPFPIRCSIRLGERFVPGDDLDAKHFGRRIEEYFAGALGQHKSPAVLLTCHEV